MTYKNIFCDFDGTLTNNGNLGPVFFDILDLLHKNQAKLYIVSGRSVSWGHFLLTHFPLDAAIMEGGGVILTRDEHGHILEKYLVGDKDLEFLELMTKKLLEDVKGCVLSNDSLGRKSDRALEYKDMSDVELTSAKDFLEQYKLNYSVSNVHLNFWCGEISKYKATEYFAKYYLKSDLKDSIFFGDALNDESMFESMPESVGVSNIDKYLDRLNFKPTHILKGPSNEGAYGVYHFLKGIFN